jgi:hypothetical protein
MLHLAGFLLTLLVHILSQRIQSTPSAPHHTFQYYYPVCTYVIPIRITIVTIIITQQFLVSSHFKTICIELCFSSDRVHIPLRISLLSPLNFQNRNRNRAVPLLQQDTPILFLSPFLLHFPGRNPPLTQHDQTPNFAALYNILPLLRCLPLGHYAGVRIRRAVYRLATGWTARGSNPVRGKILSLLHTRPILPSDPPTSSKVGIRAVHRGVKRPWHRVEPLPPPRSEVNNNNNNNR